MNKKKKKYTFKKFIGDVHLWLGLISGLVVVLLAITGCLYSFSQEFTSAFRKEAIYNEKQTQKIAFHQLWKNTQEYFGEEHQIAWAKVYNNPEKNYVFTTFKTNSEAITYFDYIEDYRSAYVNPYTGEITAIYNEEYDFFNVVKFLHWSLLFTTEIGQPIVGWSTFIFVILMITGIVLWWPKNKKARKKSLTLDWKKTTGWKRKNYDLHNVFGFYVTVLALILAFTGMVWSFAWFKSIVYVTAAQTTQQPQIEKVYSSTPKSKINYPIDRALVKVKQTYPDVNGFRFTPATDSAATINVYVQPKEGVYYKSHSLKFDQYSGKLLQKREHKDKNFGEKIITANFDIHVGSILGLPGKILMFLASLVCASLPITGFIVWWNKRKKKKNRKPKKKSVAK